MATGIRTEGRSGRRATGMAFDPPWWEDPRTLLDVRRGVRPAPGMSASERANALARGALAAGAAATLIAGDARWLAFSLAAVLATAALVGSDIPAPWSRGSGRKRRRTPDRSSDDRPGLAYGDPRGAAAAMAAIHGDDPFWEPGAPNGVLLDRGSEPVDPEDAWEGMMAGRNVRFEGDAPPDHSALARTLEDPGERGLAYRAD